MLSTLKSQWVAALRSGEYKQGIGALIDDGRPDAPIADRLFCCLGVLGLICGTSPDEMYAESTLDEIHRADLLGPWSIEEDGDAEHFDSSIPETQTTLQRKLAAMNDNELSFSEIADWIEKNVPVDQ